MVYILHIPSNHSDFNINHLEMINIMVALGIWGPVWYEKIRIHCDNLPVVEVLNGGKAGDEILAACVRNVWLLSALYNIGVNVTHIAGSENNVADLLSTWKNTSEEYHKLQQYIPNPQWIVPYMDLMLFNKEI